MNKKTLLWSIITIIITGFLYYVSIVEPEQVRADAMIKHAQYTAPKIITKAMQNFYVDCGKYPASLDELTMQTQVSGRTVGPWLKENRDPWDMPFRYDPKEKLLTSSGPDKSFGTKDDVSVKLQLN